MIRVDGVSFAYDRLVVLNEARCELGPGLTLLVGPNGCGKSTLMKILAGVEQPDSGRVSIGGHDLWRDELAARRLLAYVPEHPDITPYASLLDVLRLICRLRGEPVARAREMLDRAGLRSRGDASVRELSAGQRRRALLAAAWIGAPRVILLDEPLELLDMALRDTVIEWIAGLALAGASLVVISHHVEPFLTTAERVLTVQEGKIVGPIPLPPGLAERAAIVASLARAEI